MAILRDGTDLTSTNLQNALNSVRDRLNDVEEEDVRRHAFRRDHMPNLHDASGSGLFSEYWAGYNHDSGTPAAYDAAYNNQLHATGAGSWVGASPINLQTFSTGSSTGSGGSSGSPAIAPYGPISSQQTGWRIPADDGDITRAAEIGTPSAFSMTTEAIAGVFVRAQIELGSTTVAASVSEGMAIAIGWKDGSGSRHVVERSFRFYGKHVVTKGTLATGCFLTQTDLTAGDGTVATIFMVIAQAVSGPGTPLNDPDTSANSNEIGSYSLSILPLHAGTL